MAVHLTPDRVLDYPFELFFSRNEINRGLAERTRYLVKLSLFSDNSDRRDIALSTLRGMWGQETKVESFSYGSVICEYISSGKPPCFFLVDRYDFNSSRSEKLPSAIEFALWSKK